MAKATFELFGVYPTWLTRTVGAASLVAAAAPAAGTAVARAAVMASAAAVASHRDLAYLIADLPRGAVSTLFRKVTKQYGHAPCRADKTHAASCGPECAMCAGSGRGLAQTAAPCSEPPARCSVEPVPADLGSARGARDDGARGEPVADGRPADDLPRNVRDEERARNPTGGQAGPPLLLGQDLEVSKPRHPGLEAGAEREPVRGHRFVAGRNGASSPGRSGRR